PPAPPWSLVTYRSRVHGQTTPRASGVPSWLLHPKAPVFLGNRRPGKMSWSSPSNTSDSSSPVQSLPSTPWPRSQSRAVAGKCAQGRRATARPGAPWLPLASAHRPHRPISSGRLGYPRVTSVTPARAPRFFAFSPSPLMPGRISGPRQANAPAVVAPPNHLAAASNSSGKRRRLLASFLLPGSAPDQGERRETPVPRQAPTGIVPPPRLLDSAE